MVEMFGLKKPLPTEISDSAISRIAISQRMRSRLHLNPPLGDRARDAAVGGEQRDAAVVIALDLRAAGRRSTT